MHLSTLQVGQGEKLRVKEGSAREFLWSVEKDPLDSPQEFVRGIVHATLSHEDGYVEGLSAEKVDYYYDKVRFGHFAHRRMWLEWVNPVFLFTAPY